MFRDVAKSTSTSATVIDRRYSDWLQRFAWFTAVATLFLICSGGMVTSKGVGLAVPDWPTTFGYMFLFPVSQWVGGIFEGTPYGFGLACVPPSDCSRSFWRFGFGEWNRGAGFAISDTSPSSP